MAKFAGLTLKAEPITISSSAFELFKQYDFGERFFSPPMIRGKEHPLRKALAKSSKKGRQHAYYVDRSRELSDSAFVQSLIEKASSGI